MAVSQQPLDRPLLSGLEDRVQARTETGRPLVTARRVLFIVILVALCVLFLFPFAWLVSASLKTREAVFNGEWIPSPPQWQNYVQIWQYANVPNWAFNSVVTSFLAAITVTISSAMVAFGFAYFRFPFRNAIFGLVLATMMLPGAVTLIPTFLIWDAIGKVIPPAGINTLTPLWAGNLFGSAFYIFLLRQFFLGLPREVFEAARVDGAGYLRMWRSIALPLTFPALVVVFIFELKAAWTDFLKPLIYLRDVNLYTLPRGLKVLLDTFSIHGGEGDIQLIMAGAVLVTLPMVIIFFLGQRYFVEGIATTGRKG